jgi:ABC-type sugar transport system ATPase subunit/ribose/xylose/arabinose/galactoside ABC-type transport system permease subunit
MSSRTIVDRSSGSERSDVTRSPVGLRNVTKLFGGQVALADVSFDLASGSVLALLGENGAGKSTCVKILCGVHHPDGGHVLIDGTPTALHHPTDATRHGIAVVHQYPGLFPDLSIAENMFLGNLPTLKGGRVDHHHMRRRANQILPVLGLRRDVMDLAGRLSASEQQLVEIGRALAARADVLILDEPTASLSVGEVERLFAVVDDLRAHGVAMMLVSHRLEEIFRVADRVAVLRDGQLVQQLPIAHLTPDRAVELMVGREVDLYADRRPVQPGPVRMRVAGLSRAGEFRDISFDVHQGEVLGLGGLVGSGRTEIARCLFGITPPDAGTIAIDGTSIRHDTAKDAIDDHVAYLSEDRRGQSLVPEFSILDNATLAVVDRATTAGLVRQSKSKAIVAPALERMRLRFQSFDQPVSTLSGGNQQKVAIAKWLPTEPDVLILDEPTQGIDVKTKSDVHEMIDELAREGLAIILISSDLPELLSMSDRILVLREGDHVATFDKSSATEQSVIAAATDAHGLAVPGAPHVTSSEPVDAALDGSAASSEPGRRGSSLPSSLKRRELGLVAAIIAFAIPVSLINGRFLSGTIQTNLSRDIALLAIPAVGQMLVMLTRNIDLSVASVIGLTAYLSADVMRDHPGAPVIVALLVATLVGIACGTVNGLVVTIGRVPSIVVTLGTLAVYRGLTGMIAGTSQVSADQVPEAWKSFGRLKVLQVPIAVPISLAVLFAVAYLLRWRRTGRELFAIGSNPDGAVVAGIPVQWRVVQAFAMSGALAGFAGGMTASRFATVDARVAVGLELTVIASVVVGGVALRGGSGTVLGVALGATMLLVIQTGLPLARVNSLWLEGVYGLVILIAVTIDAIVVKATTGTPLLPTKRLRVRT